MPRYTPRYPNVIKVIGMLVEWSQAAKEAGRRDHETKIYRLINEVKDIAYDMEVKKP